jgi:hypothetical protein
VSYKESLSEHIVYSDACIHVHVQYFDMLTLVHTGAEENFWNDQASAQEVLSEMTRIKQLLAKMRGCALSPYSYRLAW